MIVKEIVNINGKDFQKHYSDKNLYIVEKGTDREYSEVLDLIDKQVEYEETDKLIEGDEDYV